MTDTNVLSFKNYNDTYCSLVQVPVSGTYEGFRRTQKNARWLDILLAAGGTEDENVSAEWLLQYLADIYNDSFVNAACNIGLLLHMKKKDAEAACALWEEANVSLRSQRIILHHLSNSFG